MADQGLSYEEASKALHDALNDPAQLSITVTGRAEDSVPVTVSWQVTEFHDGKAELIVDTRPQLERVQLTALDPPVDRPTVCRYTHVNLTLNIRPKFEPPLGPDVTGEYR